MTEEELLLAVLNSSPVVDGHARDELEGVSGRELARRWGGTGTDAERAQLRRVRSALHEVARGRGAAVIDELAAILEGAVRTPHATQGGVVWELQVADDDRLATSAVLAWSNVLAQFPGRLRPCANEECNLFLVDHSRPGTAKWCSMATCGNRMKVRAHAERNKS